MGTRGGWIREGGCWLVGGVQQVGNGMWIWRVNARVDWSLETTSIIIIIASALVR